MVKKLFLLFFVVLFSCDRGVDPILGEKYDFTNKVYEGTLNVIINGYDEAKIDSYETGCPELPSKLVMFTDSTTGGLYFSFYNIQGAKIDSLPPIYCKTKYLGTQGYNHFADDDLVYIAEVQHWENHTEIDVKLCIAATDLNKYFIKVMKGNFPDTLEWNSYHVYFKGNVK